MKWTELLDKLKSKKHFPDNVPKNITIERIKSNISKSPKRICFGSTHIEALKVSETNRGSIIVPFEESIKLFIETETGLKLLKSRYNDKFWCPANSEEEYSKLETFFYKYQNTVFLRDTLDCSVALAEHMIDENTRSMIGELEYNAKYNNSEEAVIQLSEFLTRFLSSTSIFNDIGTICAIPSSQKGECNLPQKIVTKVTSFLGNKENISVYLEWRKDKPQIKELSLDLKLETLEHTNLNINFDIKGHDIILIDDMYQSGSTMQYVAMQLKNAGAKKIFGISLVKSRKDTDNR